MPRAQTPQTSRTASPAARAAKTAPPAKRRARRPSLSEAEFLRKALAVFVDKGFDGASIDAITAAAGIAKRTIYARYGDKENLFKAAMEQGIDEWIVPIARLRAAESGDLEETLLAVGMALVENILAPAGLRLLRLTNAVSGRMPAIGEHNVRYGEDPTIAYLADLFQRKLPAIGPDLTAEDAAEVFLHLVVGGPAIEAAWGVSKERTAVERRTRVAVRIFLSGMLNLLEASAPAAAVPLTEPDRNASAALDEALEKLDVLRAYFHARSDGSGTPPPHE